MPPSPRDGLTYDITYCGLPSPRTAEGTVILGKQILGLASKESISYTLEYHGDSGLKRVSIDMEASGALRDCLA